MDIDYMDEFRDFTVDEKNFPKLGDYVNKTKVENGIRWTLILDPAIQADHPGYRAFEEGYKRDVFIRWPNQVNHNNHPPNVPTDKNVLYGKVWPKGPAAFPDFFKKATQQWWTEMIEELHHKVPFDALWIVSLQTVENKPF